MTNVVNEQDNYSVYIHLFPDGKRYVGCTRQEPRKRWRYGQGYKNQKSLYAAIKEYGWDNIEHIVVKSNISEEEATSLEKDLIAKYKTQDPECGYNIKNGGQTFGLHSDEFLEKLHNRMVGNKYCIGRKLRKSHIEALRKANKGLHKPSKFKGMHIHSEERKKKLSEMAKQRWANPEYREKSLKNHPDMHGANNPMYGRKHTKETKEKIAEKARGRKITEKTREKLRLRNIVPVFKCDINGNIIESFESCKDAANSVSGNSTNISFCCKNESRTYKGFKWRYARDHN